MFILNWNNIIQTNLFFIYFISFITFINSQENNCISKEVETGGILKKSVKLFLMEIMFVFKKEEYLHTIQYYPMFYLSIVFLPLQI